MIHGTTLSAGKEGDLYSCCSIHPSCSTYSIVHNASNMTYFLSSFLCSQSACHVLHTGTCTFSRGGGGAWKITRWILAIHTSGYVCTKHTIWKKNTFEQRQEFFFPSNFVSGKNVTQLWLLERKGNNAHLWSCIVEAQFTRANRLKYFNRQNIFDLHPLLLFVQPWRTAAVDVLPQ